MNRATLILCLFGIVTPLLVSNVAARLVGEGIIGGEVADEKQFPYQVALRVNGKTICGGGIIGDKYILTAAHCFIDGRGFFMNRPYKVVAGATDLNIDTGIEVAAEKVFVHSGFERSKGENDIAILKLEKDLEIDSDPALSKLSLPKVDADYTDRTAVVSGYGFNSLQGTDNKLRFAEVYVISNNDCKKKNYPRSVSESNICGHVKQHSRERPEGICSSDSGGPLVIDDDVVIGIASRSPIGCDESEKAATYTRVSSFLSFIEKVLKGEADSQIRELIPFYDEFAGIF